ADRRLRWTIPACRREIPKAWYGMSDLPALIGHWGYIAIFVTVVLGNIGLPVPEETVLAVAGYLVWRGELNLIAVLIVGIVSAVAGDNLGYWLRGLSAQQAAAAQGAAALCPLGAGSSRTAEVHGGVRRAPRTVRGLPGQVRPGDPLHGRAT